MESLHIKYITWFSLDVEGAELEVLKTFDFSKVRVDVLVVEANKSDEEEKNSEIEDLITSNGMRLFRAEVTTAWQCLHVTYRKNRNQLNLIRYVTHRGATVGS